MIETKTPVRDIPIWLTAIVLMLCIGGGIYLVAWYMRDRPVQSIELTNDQLPSSAKGRGNMPVGPNPGGAPGRNWVRGNNTPTRTANSDIETLSPSSWKIKAGTASMNVTLNRKGELDLNPTYGNLYTSEQAEFLIMRQRLITDQTMRDFISLTDDQLAKLKAVPAPQGMQIDADERAKLTEQFKAWRDAKEKSPEKATAEKTLVATFTEVSKKHFDQAKAYTATRVEAVKTIVTPEQVKLFKDGPSATPKVATPPVTPKPAEIKPAESKPAEAKPPLTTPAAQPTPAPTEPQNK